MYVAVYRIMLQYLLRGNTLFHSSNQKLTVTIWRVKESEIRGIMIGMALRTITGDHRKQDPRSTRKPRYIYAPIFTNII